ncbi:MAG: SRPBCC domain-containing protein [Candidatus Bathyarchaeia archaeon]
MTPNNQTRTTPKSEVMITRVFDAPRRLVWKAWTDPETMKRWWGPKNFTAPIVEIDLRVGGKSLACMRSPEGKDYWSTGVYQEIVPMERLVMTDSFADEKGNVVPATHYGMSKDFPRELLITVTFEKQNGKTTMTLRHGPTDKMSAADRDGMEQGWNESFDKLEEELRKQKLLAEPV